MSDDDDYGSVDALRAWGQRLHETRVRLRPVKKGFNLSRSDLKSANAAIPRVLLEARREQDRQLSAALTREALARARP